MDCDCPIHFRSKQWIYVADIEFIISMVVLYKDMKQIGHLKFVDNILKRHYEFFCIFFKWIMSTAL